MLQISFMKQLKQVNVSKDEKKTAERVKEAFASASKEQKAKIIAQTCQNRNSIYRVTRTGSSSARIIVALAEVLSISPKYLDGSSDDKGTCSDEIIREYLLSLGYKKLLATIPASKQPRQKRAASKKPAAVPEKAPEAQSAPTEDVLQPTIFRVTINESAKMYETAKNLDLQNATQLLEALFIRAKAGGNAERLCEVVKHCLLS